MPDAHGSDSGLSQGVRLVPVRSLPEDFVAFFDAQLTDLIKLNGGFGSFQIDVSRGRLRLTKVVTTHVEFGVL
jgi:hypothetical protein